MALNAGRDARDRVVEVRYQATKAELAEALCVWSGRTTPGARRIACLAGLTAGVAATAWLPGPWHLLAWLALAPSAVLLRLLYIKLWLRLGTRQMYHWSLDQGLCVIRLGNRGVQAGTAHFTATYQWTAFQSFHETPNLWVLSVSARLGGICVLPKRSVREAADAEFIGELFGRYVTEF
ncbi:YcxB family protein [Streptomyces sp. NPDC006527]|uniref:YcxB family protein n=1 Tax=Streptomyces sp. NPDC006527 TaxID=3364749 RepID=UPI0036884443